MADKKFKIGTNSKLKSFLLFVLLATVFWFFAKFSKEYSGNVVAKLNYTNVPVNALLADDQIDEVSFDLFANGFEFLIFKIKKPTVDVPVSKYYENGDQAVTIGHDEFARLILNQLNNSNDLHNLSVDELTVKLNSIIIKNVLVKPKISVNYKEGFKALGDFKTKPDSVQISGPAKLLDSIQFLESMPMSLEEVEEDIETEVTIKNPSNGNIKISPTTVIAVMEVGEFTQKRIEVPIQLKKVPSNIRLKLIPEKVSLVFNVSLKDFKNISSEDFLIECDYSLRNESENFMIPKLVKSPDFIQNIELETKKIDFLIFK